MSGADGQRVMSGGSVTPEVQRDGGVAGQELYPDLKQNNVYLHKQYENRFVHCSSGDTMGEYPGI